MLVLLLGSIRGGLVAASLIPLSLLFAFILMRVFGVWANLMSLGAIDFGIIVDGAVIIVEGTVYELERHFGGRLPKGARLSQKGMDAVSIRAAGGVMHSAFFGQIIILIVFIPILFLSGVSGKMFQPMAFTFSFALIGPSCSVSPTCRWCRPCSCDPWAGGFAFWHGPRSGWRASVAG